MEIIYVDIYNCTELDGSITEHIFSVDEPSLEYIILDNFDGMIEVFTN